MPTQLNGALSIPAHIADEPRATGAVAPDGSAIVNLTSSRSVEPQRQTGIIVRLDGLSRRLNGHGANEVAHARIAFAFGHRLQ